MSVERTASTQTRRCDIVCFVNGIPFVVIENKRPSASLKKADSQLIGYQSEDNIPQLFHFAQLLMSMKRTEARYATVGTPRKFWQVWREKDDRDEDILPTINKGLTGEQKKAIFSGDFAGARKFFEALGDSGDRAVTEQDRLIYGLCRRERLLDMVRRFTVFDGGIRKVARHQQFFGIRAAIEQVKQFDNDGRRKGGGIWHTQGSGKSLTMVMLGRALALDKDIKNPRLIIVTDRDDLDKQIKGTFKSCEMEPKRAATGSNLIELIENKTPLITTIINKFDTAMKASGFRDDSENIFVLIDESHRSQTGRYGGHGKHAIKMRRILPKACYLGFTGTPLLKKDKNTLKTFGGLIHHYKIDEAVADEAVVPLLYEGRMVEQQVSGDVIDTWFDKISEGLTDKQKADLKRKFSRMDALAKTGQAIRAKAFDISEHYRRFWQGTGFKAQLVAPSKAAAIRFKEVLDEIGHVTSEIIISAPDDKEGNEEFDKESKDIVRKFWDEMMTRYKSESEYNRQIIDDFKSGGSPEILIVVSKLLTGFDAPRNTVLYVCKPLKEHNLLQAVARVNRLFEEDGKEKQFGFIIDYEGLLGELDQALSTYSAFEGFDTDDISGTIHDVREEIRKLPQFHDQLWDMFKTIKNKKDMEQFEQYLGDEAKRHEFYARLRAFGRCLHISLSSEKLYDVFPGEATVSVFTNDWKAFSELKRSVRLRYQEVVDIKEFEPKIQKLLDDHVTASPAEVIIETVNINDPDALNKVIEEEGTTAASKADRIASATKRTITERMDEDPAFYKQFKELLEETLRNYRDKRISEKVYLSNVVDLASLIGRKDHGRKFTDSIKGDEDAQAVFGIVEPALKGIGDGIEDETAADISRSIVGIIKDHHIVDVWMNEVAQNNMRNAIDDYFFDVIRDEKGIDFPMDKLDEIEIQIMEVARARFPA